MAAAIAGVTYGLFWYRHRLVRSNADLIALLPSGDTTRLFVDVALLRRAGLLALLAQDRLGQDTDYQAFEVQTHFDYTKDLDSLTASVAGEQLQFLLRGRFDRDRLRRYAVAHRGACGEEVCRVPTTQAGRSAEFTFLQPDVLALSVGKGGGALKRDASRRASSRPPVSADPVWVEFSFQLLKEPSELPLALQIFAISLQSAHPVVLSLAAAGENGTGGYLLKLEADFPNGAAADTARKQWESETKALSRALEKQQHPADPKDVTGLLASGTFQVTGNRLFGQWLIRPELVRSLR